MKRRLERPLLFLGVDTSSYTTSAALVDEAGDTVWDGREPLRVPPGALGLRQSDAVFLHLKGVPGLLVEALERARRAGRVAAVGVSARPRPEPRSYLPVFLVGWGFGRAAAAALGAELVPTSHQQGHLACALAPCGLPPAGAASNGGPFPNSGAAAEAGPAAEPRAAAGDFLVLQASGGTTELSVYRPGPRGPEPVRVLGSSQDLHAGQFVDRVGRALGLPFPAGPTLEALAGSGRPGAVRLPEAVSGYRSSFSGPHSAARRCLEAGARPADVALAALDCVARTLGRMLARAEKELGLGRALVVGGVAASLYLRACLGQYVSGYLRRRPRSSSRTALPEGAPSPEGAPPPGGELELVFPPPALCTDNAVGPARLARWALGAAVSGRAGLDAGGNSGSWLEDIQPPPEN